jgi:hypothetical protein
MLLCAPKVCNAYLNSGGSLFFLEAGVELGRLGFVGIAAGVVALLALCDPAVEPGFRAMAWEDSSIAAGKSLLRRFLSPGRN